MGRKPKNKFIETSLAFKEGTEFRLYDVKIPFVYTVTIETTDPNLMRAQTTYEYYTKSASNLDILTKETENHGYKVIEIKESVRPFTDLCPRCHKVGIPKIEKKDTRDNRQRSWRNKESTSKKDRPPEFWLTYIHTKSKKCRICQYTNTPYPAFKQNKIDIGKYFFPHVLERMKKSSI